MRLAVGSRSWWLSFVLVVGSLGVAVAQPGSPPPDRRPIRPGPPTRPTVAQLVGVTEVLIRQPTAGFIDDVVATDDQRIAYVIANSTGQAELHVLSIAAKTELSRVFSASLRSEVELNSRGIVPPIWRPVIMARREMAMTIARCRSALPRMRR